jgi:tRNA pseudouridine-54 N-methylase
MPPPDLITSVPIARPRKSWKKAKRVDVHATLESTPKARKSVLITPQTLSKMSRDRLPGR